MPDLAFQVAKASAVPFTATPILALEIAIHNATAGERIQSIALRCQVRIEANRRLYSPEEQGALRDLFGEPGGWERTVHPLLWAHAGVMVPAFTGDASVELPLPCTYDFTVASARYFHGLGGGDVPLLLLFSGTVFHAREDGSLQVAQVPWSKEASYRLPVAVYRETMEHHYPNIAPLHLRRDVFDRLHRYRSRGGFPTWEQAIESLLPAEGAQETP
jgi:hypothetical protein